MFFKTKKREVYIRRAPFGFDCYREHSPCSTDATLVLGWWEIIISTAARPAPAVAANNSQA